jgi:spore coat polysaccharide biosynthesis predicted glycosyltransferase SpsG
MMTEAWTAAHTAISAHAFKLVEMLEVAIPILVVVLAHAARKTAVAQTEIKVSLITEEPKARTAPVMMMVA